MLLSRGDYEKIMVYAKLDSMSFIEKGIIYHDMVFGGRNLLGVLFCSV